MVQEAIQSNENETRQLSSNKNTSSFITANTIEVSLHHLKKECNIPVFSKDNESTISHQEFIETVWQSASECFPRESISSPEIRVSHEIKGRVPEAIGKPVKDLLEHEKTICYERASFIIEIPSIKNVINGNELSLTVGGVRAYNQENLYSKKSMEKFKVFIGFKNSVCCNLCVSTDGLLSELKTDNILELKTLIGSLLNSYDIHKHLTEMDSLGDFHLTQHQFCQFVGKSRLYQYLPKRLRADIPNLSLNDSQISMIVKAYYDDENFSASNNGEISLWKLYNLFTGATKSSYIDSFLEKTCNSFGLVQGFSKALRSDSMYKWFIE
jgi:hypothetical protein